MDKDKISTNYEGATYYFYFEESRIEFQEDLGKHITKRSSEKKRDTHRHTTHHCC